MSVIPGGSSTASKSPTRFVQAAPKHFTRADGCHVLADGKWFLDFGMGLGACVLGYAHPEVNMAAKDAISEGNLATLPPIREERTAEALLRHVPWADQLRWAKTGTDVTTAAVRLARHVTGRDEVMTQGYHGWADWSVVVTPPALGIPQTTHLTSTQCYWLEGAVDMAGIAAVVVEVAPGAQIEDYGWLAELRWRCDEAGALLIFDEVLSGFRFRMGSASDVIPDIACFGKSIANGFPLACLVAKRDIMRHLEPGGVFFSGTAFGETSALAACEATLEIMERQNVPDFIGKQGRRLRDGFNRLADTFGFPDVRCVGDGARTTITGLSHDMRDLLQQECAKLGMIFIGSHIMSLAHNDGMVDEALSIYEKAMVRVANGVTLEGEPSTLPYRMQ